MSNFLRIIIFIIGLILFADGLFLMLQKKLHLGTVLPFMLGVIFCLHAVFIHQIHQYLATRIQLKRIWASCWILFSIWLISLLGFFVYLNAQIQHSNTEQKVDAIIVLGSGIIQGKASPTLALRLDRAAQVSKAFPNALIIVTGGQDYGEIKTEAEVMSAYLQQNFHINASKIQQEDQSTSTELNLKNSQPILNTHDLSLDSAISIVTSDFHTLRAEAIAHKQGYTHILMISAETPLMTRYNAWLREYFAYMSGWLFNEY